MPVVTASGLIAIERAKNETYNVLNVHIRVSTYNVLNMYKQVVSRI